MSSNVENVEKVSYKIAKGDYKGIYEGGRGEYHEVVIDGVVKYVPVEGTSLKDNTLEMDKWLADELGIS
jgi:hypothetical protein